MSSRQRLRCPDLPVALSATWPYTGRTRVIRIATSAEIRRRSKRLELRTTPEERELIERVFEAPVFETYGSREFMLTASECERHRGLHITHEHLLVEVLDESGRPAAEGEEGESLPTAGSSHAFCASSSASTTGMRSWIAAATRLGAESHVSRQTLCSHSPSTFAGVHSAANANGTPPSTWKWKGWRGSPLFSGFSHS